MVENDKWKLRMDVVIDDILNNINPLVAKYVKLKKELRKLDNKYCQEQSNNWKNYPDLIKLCASNMKGFNKDRLLRKCVRFTHSHTQKVSEAVKVIMQRIEEGLQAWNKGELIQDGSSEDGTKIGSLDEMDFLYDITSFDDKEVDLKKVCDSDNYVNDNNFEFFYKGNAVSSKTIYKEFASQIEDIMKDINLEDMDMCISVINGGFASPTFSGVRLNEPAVTVLLLVQDMSDINITTIDLAPGVRLPERYINKFAKKIDYVLKPFREANPTIEFNISKKLHLIPTLYYDNIWYVTTACLEAQLLRHDQGLVKRVIQKVKATRDTLIGQTWKMKMAGELVGHKLHDRTEIKSVTDVLNTFKDHVHQCQSSSPHKCQTTSKISRYMQLEHIKLPLYLADQWNEVSKPEISINTAAIKSLVLTKASELSHVFTSEAEREKLEEDLEASVWKDLAEGLKFRVPHALLPCEVRIFSIGAYAADHWFDLLSIMKEQCKMVSTGVYKERQRSDTSDVSSKFTTNDLMTWRSIREELQKIRMKIQRIRTDHELELVTTQLPDYRTWGVDQPIVLQGDYHNSGPFINKNETVHYQHQLSLEEHVTNSAAGLCRGPRLFSNDEPISGEAKAAVEQDRGVNRDENVAHPCTEPRYAEGNNDKILTERFTATGQTAEDCAGSHEDHHCTVEHSSETGSEYTDDVFMDTEQIEDGASVNTENISMQQAPRKSLDAYKYQLTLRKQDTEHLRNKSVRHHMEPEHAEGKDSKIQTARSVTTPNTSEDDAGSKEYDHCTERDSETGSEGAARLSVNDKEREHGAKVIIEGRTKQQQPQQTRVCEFKFHHALRKQDSENREEIAVHPCSKPKHTEDNDNKILTEIAATTWQTTEADTGPREDEQCTVEHVHQTRHNLETRLSSSSESESSEVRVEEIYEDSGTPNSNNPRFSFRRCYNIMCRSQWEDK